MFRRIVDVLGIETQGEIVMDICPPVETMTPCGFSSSRTSITRSNVKFVKVKPVAHIVVGRYGFGIIVDHHQNAILPCGS
ncbi:MAG: hypothetical protein ACLULL_05775 [Parabacteroides distasonis]